MIAKLRQLTKNETFVRYLKNSSWMFSEYMLRIVSAIFVSIYVARYLGPEQFGTLSYALAIVAIFIVISRLGMESVLVRDLAKHPGQFQSLMGTAYILMLISGTIAFCTISILIFYLESDSNVQIYIWIIATSLMFQAFLVVDYGFQSRVNAKYSSIAKSVALATSSLVKILLVWLQEDLFLFVIAYAFDHFVIAAALLVMHFIQKQSNFIFIFDKSLIRPLLISAWPMVLSAVSVVLYMRVDQIMIMNMLDAEELGLYSAATKIFEGWVMLIYVLSISILPLVVRLKESSIKNYDVAFSNLYSMVIWASIFVALITTYFSDEMVMLIFGPNFLGAATVLSLLMWAAVFAGVNSLNARYFTAENMEKKIAHRAVASLIVNVSLNFILIPAYGIEGAVWATMLSLFVGAFLMDYFYKDLKKLRLIKYKALVFRESLIKS